MQQIILVIHVLVAVGIISLVLLQHGKGADVGAAFGSGAAETMFGSQGAVPFLMKLTAILAAVFFITSLTLGYLAAHTLKKRVKLNNDLTGLTPTAFQSVKQPTSISVNKKGIKENTK